MSLPDKERLFASILQCIEYKAASKHMILVKDNGLARALWSAAICHRVVVCHSIVSSTFPTLKDSSLAIDFPSIHLISVSYQHLHDSRSIR